MTLCLAMLPAITPVHTVSADYSATPASPRFATSSSVKAVVSDPNNANIAYIGGDFTEIGVYRGRAVPLDTNGDLVGTFPTVDGTVHEIIPDGSGGWYVGGEFSTIGGAARNYVAQINSEGSVTSWNPNVTGDFGSVRALATDGTNVYIGGFFTAVGGTARDNLAAVSVADGTLDAWNPDPNSTIFDLKYDSDVTYGDILYVGGLLH